MNQSTIALTGSRNENVNVSGNVVASDEQRRREADAEEQPAAPRPSAQRPPRRGCAARSRGIEPTRSTAYVSRSRMIARMTIAIPASNADADVDLGQGVLEVPAEAGRPDQGA